MTHLRLDFPAGFFYNSPVHQIVFNEISAAELSTIPPMDALELISAFRVDERILKGADNAAADAGFGMMEHEGKTVYRFRKNVYRVYFTIENEEVVVQRVLHANSLKDFLFRSSVVELDDEDRVLGRSRSFWNFIDEGVKAPRKQQA